MKAFTVLLLVTAFSFLAQAKPEGLRPRNIVVPPHPQNTTEEWNPKMAAQLSSPKYFPSLTNDTKSEPDRRITNGIPAIRGQFPWQAGILIDSSSFCGGSLISDRWILTAAHCTYNGTIFTVALGTVNITDLLSGHLQNIALNSTVHSGYDPDSLSNDIALLELLLPFEFSLYISPVRLPSRSEVPSDFVGETVRCSGWGQISDLSPNLSDSLKYADMLVIENKECLDPFQTLIRSTNICVSTADKRSPCNGDSGGPLVVQEDDGRYTEIGIVSFGHVSGCELGFPAVFTRVTSYLDWIEQNTDIVIA